jgi:hypothetical protein
LVVRIYKPYKKESETTMKAQFDLLLKKLTSIKIFHSDVGFVADFNVDFLIYAINPNIY